jgi:hypothetical protein
MGLNSVSNSVKAQELHVNRLRMRLGSNMAAKGGNVDSEDENNKGNSQSVSLAISENSSDISHLTVPRSDLKDNSMSVSSRSHESGVSPSIRSTNLLNRGGGAISRFATARKSMMPTL